MRGGRERVKNAASAVAHQKIKSWKGQGMMQKREEQDEVTSNSQQARTEWIRGIFFQEDNF